MSNNPKFTLLQPTVLDYSRVSLMVKTADLPAKVAGGACAVPPSEGEANVSLSFDLDTNGPPKPVAPPDNVSPPDPARFEDESPWPTLELALLDEDDELVAQALIIEHQEADVSFTLHVRRPQPGKLYTVMARMSKKAADIHIAKTQFLLEPAQ